ncbi:hypothetical protein GOP47_0012935 [Adiantum capillus-veneris]|uniref:Serine/threonine-protein phosphatase n=1 Tax=Adiantum capillus-veneris TaxID=13818 RepID=A0A9D4UQH0_ADICA|nr:hypothetical protein GOP47_0012335 [Adiantum capillus-veneris]KAI5072829.1 hypothetical protein GOP47_0012935 [Adiantum capillus-veneris]
MEVESGIVGEQRQPGSPLPLPPWAQSPPSSPLPASPPASNLSQQQPQTGSLQTQATIPEQPQSPQPPQSTQLSHQQPRGAQTNHQPPVVPGPKPAPAYRVLATVIEKKDDGPGPRCGHTLTALAAVGEEGSPSYVGPRLILFGGATALEGSSAQASPQTPTSNAGIRLAGATADVHCYDVASNKWTRLQPVGEPPSPRAAHAAAAVGTMVVIQGGIGPAGMSPEDLHVLDLTQSRPRWHRVSVQGPGPGPRYGHAMALVGQRFLLAVGGNEGRTAVADVWSLDTAAKPYEWKKLEPEGECPPPCMYATASARGDGLLLLCGGRDASNVPLSSAYGLAKHRDGRWEWAVAPGISPAPRYQHAATFVNARLHVSGGNLGGGRMVDDASNIAVLDTAAGAWLDRKGVVTGHRTGRYSSDSRGGDPSAELTRRCRHAAASVGNTVYIYGGLRAGEILDDMLVADDSAAIETIAAPFSNIGSNGRISHGYGGARPESQTSESVMIGYPGLSSPNGDLDMNVDNGSQEGHQRKISKGVESLVEASAAEAEAMTAALRRVRQIEKGEQSGEFEGDAEDSSSPSKMPATGSLSKVHPTHMEQLTTPVDVRLCHRAVVVAAESGGALGGLVRQLSIDQFENEGRRVSYGTPENASAARKLLDRQMPVNNVSKKVIAQLLRPRGWKPPLRRQFILDCNEVLELCDCAERIFSQEPTVLQLRAPVKIFGDLHGQFGDLMRLFDEYGSPSTAGDITYIDYLFLGDYVDRGQHSLETITLLLALKVEYPRNVHLIRGNHEAADINALFGFRIECIERMGEREGNFVWRRINQLFDWLPLAALIESKIICMHGGIGRSINHVGQIENLQRPITMETGSVVLMDLLWSDPTENDSVEGLRPNARGPGLVTFGPDRVLEFCKNNDLQLIIRAHECVMDGFERFAQGHLITLFSATNYCGTANNAGAILVLGRDLIVVPKLIHPLPPAITSPEASPERLAEDTWMQELNTQRPPTPTRGRPPSNDRNSLAWI